MPCYITVNCVVCIVSGVVVSFLDCSTVATKLQFIMDDLLWIVTDSQMKAAVVFATHLKDNMDKAKEQSKQEASRQLQVTFC